MVERSNRMWSTGEGSGKPLQYSCLENPMNSMKRQNGSGQTRDGKSERRHSRNQRTEMTIIFATAGRNPSEEME